MTPGTNELTGTSEPDTLDGMTASDTIRGLAGDDTIRGEPLLVLRPDQPLPNTPGAAPVGDNTIFGNEGNDAITAGLGSDTVEGGPGDDGISGAGGVSAQGFVAPLSGPISSALALDTADLLRGGDGSDTVPGQGGADSLFGDAGDDTLGGGTGADLLTGAGQGCFRLLASGAELRRVRHGDRSGEPGHHPRLPAGQRRDRLGRPYPKDWPPHLPSFSESGWAGAARSLRPLHASSHGHWTGAGPCQRGANKPLILLAFPRTTNLGVRGSNPFGRATSRTTPGAG
jgi:hypothetical protein